MTPSRISTCLWFDRDAEEAANLYVFLIPNSRITGVSRYGKGAPLPEGTALTVTFELDGFSYMGLNGGSVYKLNEACSIVVNCETQAEIDGLWTALTANGGKESRCGWLKDRFGLSWQIVPANLAKLMSDPKSGGRVFPELMKMTKLDIARLEAAARGEV